MDQQQKPFSQRQASAGETIHQIADQLKQESKLQIKAISRILGAAAQIAENHDQLIDEVVDMVNADLDSQVQVHQIDHITVNILKQQFRTLGEAKSHFGLKANSWATLAKKLNYAPAQNPIFPDRFTVLVSKRFDVIEGEIRIMRSEIGQIRFLLEQLILEKK